MASEIAKSMASAQDLNSGDEDHTDSYSGCESELAHIHAQLHNKSEITQVQALEIDFVSGSQ